MRVTGGDWRRSGCTNRATWRTGAGAPCRPWSRAAPGYVVQAAEDAPHPDGPGGRAAGRPGRLHVKRTRRPITVGGPHHLGAHGSEAVLRRDRDVAAGYTLTVRLQTPGMV